MTEKQVQLEITNKIGILHLVGGVTNPINQELIDELSKFVNALKDDNKVKGVVLTSQSEKFFSIGFDLPQLYKQSQDEIQTFYHSFNQLCIDLYTIPKPTVAAIIGHAIAGGCILSLCCDYRFIASGRKLMGLNEIKLGLPVPYPADCILRQLVGDRVATELMYTGDFYAADDLLKFGLVDRILPDEKVIPESIEKVKLLGSMPKSAFEMIKFNRVSEVQSKILERLPEKEQYFLDHWHTDEVRELLKEAIKKF
jgi:enoyl-CoA hydratase/carnithine racemase